MADSVIVVGPDVRKDDDASSTASSAAPAITKVGTYLGVVQPCLLSIFGSILFLLIFLFAVLGVDIFAKVAGEGSRARSYYARAHS